jgi:hypothetical protein
MSIMLGKLYLALKEGGASEASATEAASEVAGYENRLARIESDVSLLKWMVGAMLALQLITLGKLLVP